MSAQPHPAYDAAQGGAAFFPQSEAGYLRLTGDDRSGFLQRQTTNDLRRLAPERALLTVLTSPTARILDVLYLLEEPEAIVGITLPGRSAATARFLKTRIFFMDKVTVQDASETVVQVDLLGPQAGELLSRLNVERIPTTGGVISAHLGPHELRILALDPAFGLGFRLIAPAAASGDLSSTLLERAAARLDPETYDLVRIETGLPAAGQELIEDFTPLETGLETAIADDKGCYTGQEIIARQITYDKVTQRLCGLRLESEVNTGERVWAEGRPAGRITSAAQSPRFGAIALAVLKRAHIEPGTAVKVGRDSETAVPAVVSPLPFHEV